MPTIRLQQFDVSRIYLAAAPLLLAACANQPEAVEEVSEAPAAQNTAEQRPLEPATGPVVQDDSLLSQLVIHFDYDASTVAPNYEQMLMAHGRHLADNSALSLRLEGHADERGTREYNVGLGSRRANAVRQLLLLQGASDEQIEVLSYGEERPVIAAHNESGWSQNRRVEFNYVADR